jgi:HlyD family secretion protein
MKRALIGVAVGVVLVAIVVASIRSGGRKSGPRVYVEAAARHDITRVVKASGRIDPRVKVNLSAHVIGKIAKLFVEEGDWIDAGKPFLVLETEAFVAARDQTAAQVAIARSNLKQAEIRLEDARIRLRRTERLRQEGIASVEQLEQSQLEERSAALQLEEGRESVAQSQAALDKAQDDLSKATIYAPLSGRVIELNAEQGEVVVSGTMNNPASVIGVIADLSEILAEVDVDETEVAYLAEDQQATLEVDALPGEEYRGRVVEIGSSGFERPQQPDVTFFKVKVLLDEPDPALRPGMSVRASINTAESPGAVTGPIQAVVDRLPLGAVEAPAGSSAGTAEPEEVECVLVVDEKDVVHQRQVATGLSDATRVEIVGGLEEGERVVTGPYREIRDLEEGDSVRIREAKRAGSDENEDEDEDE